MSSANDENYRSPFYSMSSLVETISGQKQETIVQPPKPKKNKITMLIKLIFKPIAFFLPSIARLLFLYPLVFLIIGYLFSPFILPPILIRVL
jgi:hypothetical protein